MQRVRARQAPYGGLGQPWTMPWGPGTSLSGLYNLYPSVGDITLAADIPTAANGPMQVLRAGALTINSVRTVTNACRGLVILASSVSIGASGVLHMAGKGAQGSPAWANQNIGIPSSMTFTGRKTDRAAFFAWLASTGYCIFDPTLFACPPIGMGDVNADYASWPSRFSGSEIISISGCGNGTARVTNTTGPSGGAGSLGGTGGGGGGGAAYPASSGGRGTQGFVWRSGMGGGGAGNVSSGAAYDADMYGDAGWPWGPGGQGAGTAECAGVLIIIAPVITIASGGQIYSDGQAGGDGTYGGGGSGGGSVSLFGNVSNSGSVHANGGPGGTINGGPGGAGTVTIKNFATMGW